MPMYERPSVQCANNNNNNVFFKAVWRTGLISIVSLSILNTKVKLFQCLTN
jgi:hypothetical protein